MRILKFGGTSVGSAEAFDQVAKIVARARQQDSQIVVVTSAMSGVTAVSYTHLTQPTSDLV